MAQKLDTIVVGAGIAGTFLAGLLARGGRHVALLDRCTIDAAGPGWFAGVPRDVFDPHLPIPQADEVMGWGENLIFCSYSGRAGAHLAKHDVIEVDLARWGKRSRLEVRAAGVRAYYETAVEEVLLEGPRPVGVRTHRGDELLAPLLVDASGLRAVIRKAVFPEWPEVAPADLCLAAQAVHAIDDHVGACEFLERKGIRDEDTLAFTSVRGGFSLLQSRVRLTRKQVYLLTGAVVERQGDSSGAGLLNDFLDREGWVGARLSGGSAPIPIRRPYSRLTAPGMALLGDAACQVYPPSASGIALGIRAARLLADAVLSAPPEQAGDEGVLWDYSYRFHRQYGGAMAGNDLVRRMSQSLTADQAEALFRYGLIGEGAIRAALAQRMPSYSPREALGLLRGLKSPRVSARAAAYCSRIPLCMALARTYPRAPDSRALRRYEARIAMVLGEPPQPVT